MPIIVGTLIKDPQETRFYKMDWSAPLGTDTIVYSTWEIPGDELTLVANGIVQGNTKTYVLLANGSAGHSYLLVNTITTSNNEVWQRTGRLNVSQY